MVKHVKYHIDKGSRKSKRQIIAQVLGLLMIIIGGYFLMLSLSPRAIPVSSSIDLNIADDEQDMRNRIQIEKINLEVPYFEGDASTLNKGAWWRFAERGNPKDGGNFILSAHRFYLGLTPSGTRKRSPFYNLDKLEPGDRIRTFYDNQWYEYLVTKKYSVKPNAVEIESPTESPRMTLYTCTLRGSADGRVVIEAILQTSNINNR